MKRRAERLKKVVRLLLDDEERIRERLQHDPEGTRELLVEWLEALATPVTFGRFRGMLLGEVYVVAEPYIRWLVEQGDESPLVERARLLLKRGRDPLRWW